MGGIPPLSNRTRARLRAFRLSLLLLCVFAYGMAAGAYRLFPFHQVESLHAHVTSRLALTPKLEYRHNAASRQRGLERDDWDTKARIVMIGDSITELAPLKDMFPGHDILNRGAAGNTVSDVEARLDLILRASPERALLLVGTNDINLMNPTERALDHYDAVVVRLLDAGVSPAIMTIPTCEPTLDLCNASRKAREKALNDGIATIARQRNVDLIDLARLFPAGSQYRADGVHPTVEGFKAMRKILTPHLEGATASASPQRVGAQDGS